MEESDWSKVIAIGVLGAFLGLVAFGTVLAEHFYIILTATLGFLFGIGTIAVGARVVKKMGVSARHFVPPSAQHITVASILGIGMVANVLGVLASDLLLNMTLALVGFTFGTTIARK